MRDREEESALRGVAPQGGVGDFRFVGIVLTLNQAKPQLETYRGVLRVLQSTEGIPACGN